jgi:phosphate transport system permease protein
VKLDGAVYARRRAINTAVMAASVAVTALALVVLALVLGTLLIKGTAELGLRLFTETTPPPGSEGGLANAIAGSVLITGIGLALGAPIGVLAGTWLAEFSGGSRVADVVRFVSDVLLSAPSILIGLFVYLICVVPVGHFSAWSGSIALALIAIPIVLRTTEDMLRLVPAGLREAAAAIGAPRWRVVTAVCWRAARSGMITGILLALARISGETAPLLFTALNNQFWSVDLNRPMATLPAVIFQFAMSPYESWQGLACAGALLITTAVLMLNVAARAIDSPRRGRT